MSTSAIIEFIGILKNELDNCKNNEEITKIEESYKKLNQKFKENINSSIELEDINKYAILNILESVNITFNNAIILKRVKLKLLN